MKRLCLFAAAFVLSAALIAGVAVSLFAAQEWVEVRQVLTGDREAMKGLNVSFFCEGGLMGWHTTLPVGGEAGTDFLYEPQWDRYDPFSRHVLEMDLLSTNLSYGGSTGQYIPAGNDTYAFSPLRDIQGLAQAASRTGAGETRQEVMSLSDFYGWAYWNMSASYYYLSSRDSTSQTRQLAEIFKVRFPDDAQVEVTVTKNKDGGVTEISTRPIGEAEPVLGPDGEPLPDTFYLKPPLTAYAPGDVGEAGIWVYPTVRDKDGENVVEYRDGQGIYFLRKTIGSIYADYGAPTLFYPTEETPVELRLSADEKQLHFYSRVDGVLWLTVLDAGSGAVIDRWEVMPFTGEGLFFQLPKDEMLLGLDSDGHLFLTEESGGTARVVFTSKVDLDGAVAMADGRSETVRDMLSRSALEIDFAFDGERLAVANGHYDCAVLLVDKTGVAGTAAFDFSPLRDGAIYGYGSGMIHPLLFQPAMRLRFD